MSNLSIAKFMYVLFGEESLRLAARILTREEFRQFLAFCFSEL